MADDFDDLYFYMRNLFGELTFDDIGRDHLIPINELPVGGEGPISQDCTELREHYRVLMNQNGYEVNWWNAIFIGEDGMFDNSLYRVRNLNFNDQPTQNGAQGGQPEWVGLGDQLDTEVPTVEWLACKFVSIAYYRSQNWLFENSVQDIDRIIRKEGNLLIQLRDPNIVRAYAFIELRDRVAPFPNPYMAIIMELMSGTLRQLLDGYPDRKLPQGHCRIFMRNILNGLKYLHWGPHRDPDDSHPLHISHNAVFDRNILTRINGDDILFKLGDFEVTRIIRQDQLDCYGVPIDNNGVNVVFWGRDVRLLADLFLRIRPLSNPPGMQELEYEMRGQIYPHTPKFCLPNGAIEYPRVTEILENEWLNG